MKFWTFWARVFSDNGEPSFSRVASACAIAFSLWWVTFLVRKTAALPDFTGICFFIGTLYGLNLAAKSAQTFMTRPQAPPPQTTLPG